jgi:hypothetical protein
VASVGVVLLAGSGGDGAVREDAQRLVEVPAGEVEPEIDAEYV